MFQAVAPGVSPSKIERVVMMVAGCPDGVTRGAMLYHFSPDEIDAAAALCLIRMERVTVSGFKIIRYSKVQS